MFDTEQKSQCNCHTVVKGHADATVEYHLQIADEVLAQVVSSSSRICVAARVGVGRSYGVDEVTSALESPIDIIVRVGVVEVDTERILNIRQVEHVLQKDQRVSMTRRLIALTAKYVGGVGSL